MPLIGGTAEEQQFIFEQLSLWAVEVDRELKFMIDKFDMMRNTGDLRKSLGYKVFQAASGNSGKYQLSFKEYGRFVDMGVGRLRMESIKGNTSIIKHKKRRPKKFYSKTVYGMIYGKLLDRIQTNWQEHTAALIKQTLLEK